MTSGRPPTGVELVMEISLAVIALIVLGGAFAIMLTMDAGSRGQGGRFYVALAAVFALGAIDGMFLKFARRHWPLELGPSRQEREYALISMLLLLFCAIALVGFGLLFP
jgi:hypothetical protein